MAKRIYYHKSIKRSTPKSTKGISKKARAKIKKTAKKARKRSFKIASERLVKLPKKRSVKMAIGTPKRPGVPKPTKQIRKNSSITEVIKVVKSRKMNIHGKKPRYKGTTN